VGGATIEHMFTIPTPAASFLTWDGIASLRRAISGLTSHHGIRADDLVSDRSHLKFQHEIRDPIYGFITINSHERRVLDSQPVQRLRHISQLAMSYYVYPGATHRRFEHSLGVMHLAGEAFDVLNKFDNVSEAVREVIPQLNEPENLPYWRSVVRMAALCHDLGHLPFSHAAEHEMLPHGVTHETLSKDVILSNDFAGILSEMTPPLNPGVIAKLAVGPGKHSESFNVWEAILSEIITGDAFGVDRMDYLLRDSLHAGVAYGRFDHLRLLQSLRLLHVPPERDHESSSAPTVGVVKGGLSAAEGLLLARYFMFGQVYFHPIRVAYDIHLIDFLSRWLEGGKYKSDLQSHLNTTDDEVWVGIRKAAADSTHPAHDPARRILHRDHFRLLYQRRASDIDKYAQPGKAISDWARGQFGDEAIRHRTPKKAGGALDFPVLDAGGSIASSTSMSDTLRNLPPNTDDLVFVRRDLLASARQLLEPGLIDSILSSAATAEASAEDFEAANEQAITDAKGSQ
jgi:uncharacterized protein